MMEFSAKLQLQSVDFGTADLKKLEAKTQFGGA